MKLASAQELDRLRSELAGANGRDEIIISADATCCLLRGAKGVVEAFRGELAKAGLADKVHLRLAGCLGFCEIEPMVILKSRDILYQRVEPEDVAEIVGKSLLGGRAHRAPALPGPGHRAADVQPGGGALLRQAAPPDPGGQRAHRAGAHRGLPRHRRLRRLEPRP